MQLVRGFRDILPGEIELWQHIENTARSLFEDFGFREIRVPIMEHTELFRRSIGADTDIVEKEMYTLADGKGRSLTLRPEATASVVRAYIEHRLFAAEPAQKLYTIGPMFRRERPQKGRYRQFYQLNAEILGVGAPTADIQLLLLVTTLLERLGASGVLTHINSLGCPACRPAFRKILSDFIETRKATLCTDCLRRREKNPLRVLDCKVPGCRQAVEGAPSITETLCTACREHFDSVTGGLKRWGIDFCVDPRLVRGLDYYTRTTFEVQTGALGAQNAVAGGGRYDGLVKELEGPDTPAIGFAVGLDRLVELLREQTQGLLKPVPVFIVGLGSRARALAFDWACALQLKGFAAEMDYEDRSLKSQMKRADRLGARYVVIVGDHEMEEGKAIVRDMTTKEQAKVGLEDLVAHVGSMLSPGPGGGKERVSR